MALIPQDDRSAFQQQGSVDWVALVKAPVTFTVGALGRLSKANVDIFTVVTGQAMCSSFTLRLEMHRDIADHLSRLPTVSLYGKVAWIGFGLKHVLYDLIERDEGVACLVLCSCLGQCYDVFYGAQVLRAFAKLQEMPAGLLPGLHCWKALLKLCAGVLSGSKFPKLVEGYQRLLGIWTARGIEDRMVTAPDLLAHALMLLARISSKRLDSCTFTGGIDCAWLAAFAEFVLGLAVDVIAPGGDYLYRSGSGNRVHNGEAQVVFLKDTSSPSNLRVAQKCFSLPTGRSLFSEHDLNSFWIRFRAQSQWTTIIGDSFGVTARVLLHNPIGLDFAKVLAYLAHRPQTHRGKAPSRGNEKFWWPDLRYCMDTPIGIEQLLVASTRLPELRPCVEAISHQEPLRVSEEEAVLHVANIQRACPCSACSQRFELPDTFCLKTIVLSVVSCIRILSLVKDHDVLPAPSGFRRVYASHRVAALHFPDLRSSSGVQMPEDINLLQSASLLFTGFEVPRSEPGHAYPSALSAGRVAYTYGLLLDAKSPPRQAMEVYVLPGHIGWEGVQFESAVDWPVEQELDGLSALDAGRSLDLCIRETADLRILEVAYRSRGGRAESQWMFPLLPIIQGGLLTHFDGDWQRNTDQTYPLLCQRLDGHRVDLWDRWWSVHILDPPKGQHDDRFCQPGKLLLARDSTIRVSSRNGTYHKHVDIRKYSTRCWDDPHFGFDQLYAECGLYNDRPGQSYACSTHNMITRVSDCPLCTLDIVLSMWIPSTPMPETFQTTITVQDTDAIKVTTVFELKEIPAAPVAVSSVTSPSDPTNVLFSPIKRFQQIFGKGQATKEALKN